MKYVLIVLVLCVGMHAQSVADRKLCADAARAYVITTYPNGRLYDIHLNQAKECLVRFEDAKDADGRWVYQIIDVFTNNSSASCVLYGKFPVKIDKRYGCFVYSTTKDHFEDYRDKSFGEWQAAAIKMMNEP